MPHQGLITVYPKGGGEPRQASFVQYFNEDELKTANIRYFFPDGCQSPQLEIDKNYQAPSKATATLPIKVQPLDSQKPASETIDSSDRGDKNNYRSGRLRGFGGESDKEDSNLAKSGVINADKSQIDARSSSDANKPIASSVSTAGTTTSPTGASIHAHETIAGHGEGKTMSSSLGVPGEEISKADQGARTTSGAVHSGAADDQYLPPTSEGIPASAGHSASGVPSNIPSGADDDYLPPKSRFPTSAGHSASGIPSSIPSGALTVSPKTDLSKINSQNAIGRTPFKQLDNKCSDTCCDDNRPQLLMSRPSVGSCCKGVAKIIIPIEMNVLENIPMPEILEITSETKNVEMLQKLLKLVEKYKI